MAKAPINDPMPPKGKKAKPKKQAKGKKKAKNKAMVGSRSNRRVITPPVAFGLSIGTGPGVIFEGRGEILKITFRVKILTVFLAYDTTGLPTLQLWTNNSHNVLGSYFLGPNYYYMPEPIDPFIRRFMRIRWLKACFEYTPRVAGGTSSGNAITWAWMEDCCGPSARGYPYVSGQGFWPEEEDLAEISGSRQFPAWEPSECLDVSKTLDSKSWLYTAGPDFGQAFDIADVSANQRQYYPGVLLVAGNDNAHGTASTQAVQGSIWLNCTIELKDLVPPVTQTVSAVGPSKTKVEEEKQPKRVFVPIDRSACKVVASSVKR